MLESKKALLRRHFDEVLNEGKLEVVDEIYTDNYVLDAPVQTEGSAQAHGQTHGRDGLKRRVTLFRSAFPDIRFTIDNMIAERDEVVAQYTFTGTHTGQFRELTPTGNTISVTGILIAQVPNDKIEAAFSVFDSGDMMHQLAPHEHQSTILVFIEHLMAHMQSRPSKSS